MTSNITPPPPASIFETITQGAYDITSAIWNRGIYMPYNAAAWTVKTVANGLNDGIGPAFGKASEGLKIAFGEEHRVATTSFFSTCAFTYMAWKGAWMVFDPLKFEWIEFDYRFKSKLELKGKLVNLSKLIDDIAPDVVPNAAQMDAVGGSTAFLANMTAEQLETLATNAEAHAVLMEDVANPAYNPVVATAARNAATAAKEKAKKAKELAAAVKKQTEQPKKKEDTSVPEGNHLISYTVEKTKPKPDEYHIPLPMSNNALIFKWDAFQKSIKTSFAGMPAFAIGSLGVIDSFSKFMAQFPEEEIGLEPESFANTTSTAPEVIPSQTFANRVLGDSWEKVASWIGTPVQWTVGKVGDTVVWVTSQDTYGLGKLTAAAALGYGGYRLFTGGWGWEDKDKKWVGPVRKEWSGPIEGVWYDIKKAKAGEGVFTMERYTLHKGVIVRDIVKAITGTAMIGAAILSANDFFSGNFYDS